MTDYCQSILTYKFEDVKHQIMWIVFHFHAFLIWIQQIGSKWLAGWYWLCFLFYLLELYLFKDY